MKKQIYFIALFLLSFTGVLKAQETPPAILKSVNAQFYINLADSAIWQFKGRAFDGSDYGWERLARYKELTTGLAGKVSSVSGTANRITSTGGANPVINISPTFEALIVPYTGALHDLDLVTTGMGLYAENAEIGHGSSTGAGQWGAIIYNLNLAGNGALLLQTSDNTNGRVSFHQEDALGATYIAFKNDGSGVFASTLTASNFIGAGTGLTGTAPSLNIGGNANTVSNGVYTTTFNGLGDVRYQPLENQRLSTTNNVTFNTLNLNGLLTGVGINIGSNVINAGNFQKAGYTGTNLLVDDGSTISISGLQTALSGTGILSFSGTTPSYNTTSASIAALISNETGSGAMVFSTSPTFVTPTSDYLLLTNAIASAATPTGQNLVIGRGVLANAFSFKGANGFSASIGTNNLTSSIAYALPANTGTFYASILNTGTMPYAVNSLTTTGLAIGSTDNMLSVVGGLPAWINYDTATRTLTNKTLTSPIMTGTSTDILNITGAAVTPASGITLGQGVTGTRLDIAMPSGFQARFNFSGITATRTYISPDASGVFALNPLTTTGDIIYSSSSATAARLPIGSSGDILTVSSGLPAWASGSSLFVTPTGTQTLTNKTLTTPILTGYTVATLPAGTIGMTAYVTDALAPSFLVTVVGGGSIVTVVFYNGTNWVAE